MVHRLTASQLAAWRAARLALQGGACMLCCHPIPLGKEVADHDHATGHIRGVLHRSCNSLLGKVENNYKRYGVTRPQLASMLPRIDNYLAADATSNPLYPTHRSDDEKRILKNKRATRARALKKAL